DRALPRPRRPPDQAGGYAVQHHPRIAGRGGQGAPPHGERAGAPDGLGVQRPQCDPGRLPPGGVAMRATALPAREPGQWANAHWPWPRVGAAWPTALAANAGARTSLLSHHAALSGASVPLPLTLLAFLVAWQLMTVAMMLPASLPLVNLFRQA